MCFPTSGKEAQPGVNRSDEIGQRKRGNRTQDDLLDSKGVRKKSKEKQSKMADLRRAAGGHDPEKAGEREPRTKKEVEEDGEVQESDEREPETNSHFTLGWKIKED